MSERRGHEPDLGRRQAPPGGTVTGAGPPPAALLAAAVRVPGADTEGERRAVAAFRTARDTGTHRARTRRGDDWRR
ncbi:hypothetical protein ABT215_14985 [Streptomyces sp900105755]|uniref:hypothetical protein n=1 Tax=Streptomyces sp. 900105755 TaxID=3154389 RepID=UPI00332AE54E